ncbi:MAG: Rieske 2Fe-2S domain-containing protein [Pyrobaculum sp.]
MKVKLSELKEGEIYPAEGVILIKLGGEVYAYKDECPHAFCTLSTAGMLEGDVLVCTCHYCKFDVRTGRSLTPELTTEPLAKAHVVVRGDEVEVSPGE